MDQRERWQALQSHLTAARGFVDAGDRAKALEAIDAALTIDPDFLAAQSLRDRILAPAGTEAPIAMPGPARPAVSTDGYAKFEARAKRRRVDRRVDAARSAIEGRRLRDAANAIDEIIELDPNIPELAALTVSLDELRRHTATTRRGPWLAAAASFAAVSFGATWLQETRPIASVQTTGLSPLVAAPEPAQERAPVVETEPAVERETADTPVAATSVVAPTRGRMDLEPRPVAMQPREEPAPEPRVVEAPFVPRTRLLPAAEPVLPPPPVPTPAATPASMSLPISSAVPRTPEPAAAAPVPAVQPPKVDEVGLVKQVLQRYRTAYDGLDAQSAQAVFPAVNQAALARAFDGLESQTLTFDACDVQLRGGEMAVATCRGSARYVPKIGSREPRVEPRTWNFSLHKAGEDWTIDSARAER